MATPGAAFKDEGNELFKAGEYLKAAAAYTKAIKAEPKNHVFYSNRSQAFLKLSKCGKAVEDADKCIALEPTFVKGYHRKASALHATKDAAKIEEAIEVLHGPPARVFARPCGCLRRRPAEFAQDARTQ